MPKNKIWNGLFAACCLAGVVLCYLAFKPGFMSPDTIDQYEQALTGKYNDWHPVTMSLVWAVLLKVHNGPQLMLLLQLIFLWGACFFVSRSLTSYAGLLFIAVFFIAPFIHNFSGYVIKDVQMASAWLLAASLLLHAMVKERNPSRMEMLICYVLLIYGALLRIDALPGLVPLLILWTMVLRVNRWSRVLLLVVVTVGLVFITQAGLIKMTQAEATFPGRKLYMHDLAGIAVKTGTNPFPGDVYEDTAGLNINYIKSNYHPATFDMIWWNSDGVNVKPLKNDVAVEKLRGAWWTAIKRYPALYLKNRWEGFLFHLRLRQRTDYNNFYIWIDKNNYGIEHVRSPFYDSFENWIGRHRKAFYMQAWFWMAINIFLFIPVALVGDRRLKWAIVLLLLSSLLYRLPQFFVFQTDTDFRYFYWTCLTCTLAIFYVIKGIRKTVAKS